jgi:gliding motility-associated lipoprotein GldB
MKKLFCLMAIAFLSIYACQRNPLKPDISGIDVKISIKRLDVDLFKVTPQNQDSLIRELRTAYGEFFILYNKNIIALGNPSDAQYPVYLQKFLTDSMRIASKNKVDSVFHSLKWLENKLETAFRYYKFYFPQKEVPQIYTVISGFNQSVVTTSNALGISLDNYLGAKCSFYRMLGLPQYKKMNMYPEKIPTDALYSWGVSEFEQNDISDNLLSEMIYQGKLLYFLDCMFPDDPDYIKIGYQPDKIDWCKAHENSMWTYLIENKLLYSTDRMNIRRFIGQGPFTASFTNESPGKAGAWIGWQIVRQYMKKNPDISLPELMKENDSQKILSQSGYAPE